MSRVPTLVLKGVNLAKLAERYRSNGEELDLDLKPFPCGLLSPSIVSRDTKAAVYSANDKYNQPVVYATSGHSDYQVYAETGELPAGGMCPWCGRKYQKPVGVPLRSKYIAADVKGETKGCTVFWCEEMCYCSTACVYSLVRSGALGLEGEEAETLLKLMHSTMHPGSKLRASPDRRLFKLYGGPLDPDDLDVSQFSYVRTPGLVLAPLKVKYLRE